MICDRSKNGIPLRHAIPKAKPRERKTKLHVSESGSLHHCLLTRHHLPPRLYILVFDLHITPSLFIRIPSPFFSRILPNAKCMQPLSRRCSTRIFPVSLCLGNSPSCPFADTLIQRSTCDHQTTASSTMPQYSFHTTAQTPCPNTLFVIQTLPYQARETDTR